MKSRTVDWGWSVRLAWGMECDVLLLLTDGFREAKNCEGELFGESRIIETVAANAHASASEIYKSLWRAARKFVEGHRQNDDMTGIVIKVLDR